MQTQMLWLDFAFCTLAFCWDIVDASGNTAHDV